MKELTKLMPAPVWLEEAEPEVREAFEEEVGGTPTTSFTDSDRCKRLSERHLASCDTKAVTVIQLVMGRWFIEPMEAYVLPDGLYVDSQQLG